MSEQSVAAPTPHVVTRGSGAVRPIISGFHPDPTICRVGEDYYLATSSFEYFPGAPIFHSRDLVTWQQIGNILDRRSQFRLGNGGPSTGIYAGTLRHHDGRFWFITTNVSEFGEGHLLVHAEDPAGPWSEPILIPEATGIDPDLALGRGRYVLPDLARARFHPRRIWHPPGAHRPRHRSVPRTGLPGLAGQRYDCRRGSAPLPDRRILVSRPR